MLCLAERRHHVTAVQDEVGICIAEHEQIEVACHERTLREATRRYDAPMPTITLVEGDITEQDVDAIVNAANRSLLGGGGVDGAIHRRGGPAILRECERLRVTTLPDGLPVGGAVATTAGDLPARWVIHTVGPVYGTAGHAALLARSHTSSLAVADELGMRSVAFPAISTGAFGYPIPEAAAIAVRAVRDAATSVSEVRFVLFDGAALAAFEAASTQG
jgi:O-acetyl-ADP-ribose deacetylase (regulator of RNase III)